jgi:hypothetical protein
MTSYSIPKNLNGEQLLSELKNAGIILSEVTVIDDLLWLDTVDPKANEIVAKHKGIDVIPTAQQKLESAGLTVDDLKSLLGL